MKIRKLLSAILFTIPFFFFASSAQAMEITKIGTLDVTGDGIGSTVSAYTYPLRSFSLYGTANASSSVAIKIDDVTYSATADSDGDWSTYLSNLTYADHAVTVSSTGQTSLNFTLTISSSSATTTSTASTTTTTSTSTSTTALPASGTTENTFLLAAFALLTIGLGMAVKYRD